MTWPHYDLRLQNRREIPCCGNSRTSFYKALFVDAAETITLLTGKLQVISVLIAMYGKDRYKLYMNKGMNTNGIIFDMKFWLPILLTGLHSFHGRNYEGFNQTENSILQWHRASAINQTTRSFLLAVRCWANYFVLLFSKISRSSKILFLTSLRN